jgi:hypothetical protein
MSKRLRSLDRVAVKAPVSDNINLSAFFHGTGGGRRVTRKPLMEDDQLDGVSFEPPEVNLEQMELYDHFGENS